MRVAAAYRDRADAHVTIVDVPAFLTGIGRSAAGEFGHSAAFWTHPVWWLRCNAPAKSIKPIEVDHIVDYLRTQGITDEVYFWDAEIDIEVLKGTLVHWEYQMEGWTYRAADIYTARSLSLEEKRLVQAKEILHILDHRIDRVNTLEDVEALIEEMVLPESSIDPEKHSDHARSDRDAILHILPVLFPMAARDLFLHPFKENKIDIDFITGRVALPKYIVRFVMSDRWAAYYKTMMAELRAELPIPDRVHTIDANQSTIEVYSVPLEDDPFAFARRLEERSRHETTKPVSALLKPAASAAHFRQAK
jgi:hypothetical protein